MQNKAERITISRIANKYVAFGAANPLESKELPGLLSQLGGPSVELIPGYGLSGPEQHQVYAASRNGSQYSGK
ncbi:MAG: hypothetical protein HYT72_02795 [Candidatus Aenigmarchaeota archaeon]|nr:hypothetical protein [Candidatus Aenigmarchaeota archaeon]